MDRHHVKSTDITWLGEVTEYAGRIAWQAACSIEMGWSTGLRFSPLLRHSRRVCKGEVLGLRAHNVDPPGRVITMRPATVSTAVAPRHKDTPLQRHGCAFVLPHTLSVPHSRGLERHHRVPIKPLGVEDSPDSLIHKYAHTHTHSHTNTHKYSKPTHVLYVLKCPEMTKAMHCSLSTAASRLEPEWQNNLSFLFAQWLMHCLNSIGYCHVTQVDWDLS